MAKKVAKTDSQRLRPQVRKVLLEAAKKTNKPYLSAFQILDKLEPSIRDALILRCGSPGGDKAHVRRPASMVVKDAAMSLTKDIVFMDTHEVEFKVQGKNLTPSSKERLALYRLIPPVRLRTSIKRKVAAIVENSQ